MVMGSNMASKGRKKVKRRNPVHHFMNQVSKPKTERDRTKYSRKKKHKKGEE